MRARIQKISRYAPSIFQGKIDFGSGPRLSLTVEHPAERHVFRVIAASLGLFAILYGYFVTVTVLNVIVRKEALSETAALTTAVAELERDYFAAAEQLGPEDGERLGLLPVKKTEYIHRPSSEVAATLEPNGI